MAAKVIVYVKIFLEIGIQAGDFVDFVGNHASHVKFQVIGELVPAGVIFPVFFKIRVIGFHAEKFSDIINDAVFNPALLLQDKGQHLP